MHKLSVLALAVSASTIALVSGAPAKAETLTRYVSYADLDLSSPEGVTTLKHRIDRAISDVCGRDRPGGLKAASEARKCRREASVSASTQMMAAIDKARGEAYAFAGKSDQ
jgi:UrcA family protein